MSIRAKWPPRGEETRAALACAAPRRSGDKGFSAASTREIAAAAIGGVVIAPLETALGAAAP